MLCSPTWQRSRDKKRHNKLYEKGSLNAFNFDRRNNSNNGYTRHTSMDHNIFNNGGIKMIIDEKKGTVFGTWDERDKMFEKIKEISLRKKNAPIIARIDEMMRQIINEDWNK